MRINEIFYSIQGESKYTGFPTIFIRLTGCNLRCTYCDTKYSYSGGKIMSVEEVIKFIEQYPTKIVCVTGGEPLLHKKELPLLLNNLLEKNYTVSVETSGSLSIEGLPENVSYIVDLKTPSSGMEKHNLMANIPLLQEKDELKFVVETEADLKFVEEILEKENINCPVIISPVWEMKAKDKIADWLLKKCYPNVRIAVQIHKILHVE